MSTTELRICLSIACRRSFPITSELFAETMKHLSCCVDIYVKKLNRVLRTQDYRGKNDERRTDAGTDGRAYVVHRSDRRKQRIRNNEFRGHVLHELHIRRFDGAQGTCSGYCLQSLALGAVQRDKRQRRVSERETNSHFQRYR